MSKYCQKCGRELSPIKVHCYYCNLTYSGHDPNTLTLPIALKLIDHGDAPFCPYCLTNAVERHTTQIDTDHGWTSLWECWDCGATWFELNPDGKEIE